MKFLLAISLFLSTSLNAMCGCCLTGGFLTSVIEVDESSAGCCGSVEAEPLPSTPCGGNCETMACGSMILPELPPVTYHGGLSLPILCAPISLQNTLFAEAAKHNQVASAANELVLRSTLPLRHRLCVYRL